MGRRPSLIVLYLPPIEWRYTKQWLRWWRREAPFAKFVGGSGEDFGGGAFGDLKSWYLWEMEQIKEFIRMIDRGEVRDGDVVLAMDIEFPGHAWAVRHLADGYGIELKSYGWLHAGSYTYGDYAEVFADYYRWMEIGWVEAFDGVFVASNYHKRALMERRLPEHLWDKVMPVGNPFYLDDVWREACISSLPEERDYDVIITDRPDLEKRVYVAVALAKGYGAKKVAVTTGRQRYEGWNWKTARELVEKLGVDVYEGISKREYYRLLADSKVWLTASPEENFGYCAVEAMAFGAVPLMPNCCAFPEHVDGDARYLYFSLDDLAAKLKKYLAKPPEPREKIAAKTKKYGRVIKKVLEVMGFG